MGHCPNRGQYSGHVTCVVQSQASIQGWQVPLSRVLWGHVATIRSYCPAPASSGQTEYFMRAETEERQGWFNGRRCFNKIIELYWSTTRGEMINWILYWRCSKESSLKWNYHLFQHELIMFSLTFAVCQQSQSPWTSCCDEKVVTVFCICISLSSVRDERRKKVVICPLCLVSSLVLFTFCWASYLFWTAL